MTAGMSEHTVVELLLAELRLSLDLYLVSFLLAPPCVFLLRMCLFYSTCDFLYGEPVRVESCTMSFYNLCIPTLNPLGINIHFLCKLRD